MPDAQGSPSPRDTALNWRRLGAPRAPRPSIPLSAGPLRTLFEPETGFLRRIRLGEREVLRGIYAAIRDRNWGTVPPRITDLQTESGPMGFRLSFNARCEEGAIRFLWRGTLEGWTNGTLRYTFDGEALGAFPRNRIGFCVLHPIRECAGGEARQRRVDGSMLECAFPLAIEPQIFGRSSFQNLRAIAHRVGPGLWAEVEFEGDVFEMEDQRNWTDASFKTYCTPLALPFPVEIQAGARVHQTVTLRLDGTVPSPAPASVAAAIEEPEPIALLIPGQITAAAPKIGLGMASHGEPLDDLEIERLRRLRPAHLRVDVRLATPDWRSTWDRAVADADRLGVPLELALHLPGREGPEMDLARNTLGGASVGLARVLALRDGEPATGLETLRRVRALVGGRDVPVGAGSDANFCELNHEQALGKVPTGEADFLFWSVNPQVHATDALSLVETLEAQPETVRTARAFACGKPLVITPITLKPRFNAVATAPDGAPRSDELPAAVDPRQLSLFAAAWTLGSLGALAEAGIESATFFETTGWRGVMERERGSPRPRRFPSRPGELFPVYSLFKQLAGCERWEPLRLGPTSAVTALAALTGDGRARLLLGNLTPEARTVVLRGLVTKSAARVLAAEDVLQQDEPLDPLSSRPELTLPIAGGRATMLLPPYGLATVDTR